MDFCQTSVPQVFYDGTEGLNLNPDILPNEPTFGVPEGIQKSLKGINLDPDLPDYKVPEAFEVDLAELNLDPDIENSGVPQIFKDAFKEDNLLEPETFLESLNVLDSTETKLQNDIIEQINTSPEPEIAEIEARMENQSSVVSFQSSDFVMPEKIKIGEQVALGIADQISSEPQIEIQAQDEDMPEIALPELEQSVQTYNALINAGIEKEQAGVLVEQALIRAGTEPEVAQKVVEQVKTGTRTKNSHAEFISASDKILKPASRQGGQVQNDKKDIGFEEKSADAEAMADKEKKKQLKFVVDEKALAERGSALKMAVEQAPGETGLGDDIIDSNKVVALMPTEVQNQGVVSGILPKRFIEWLNLGDGAYRLWVASIRALGKLSKWAILKAGLGMNRKFYSVTIDEAGEEAGKEGIALVLEHKPDPIR